MKAEALVQKRMAAKKASMRNPNPSPVGGVKGKMQPNASKSKAVFKANSMISGKKAVTKPGKKATKQPTVASKRATLKNMNSVSKPGTAPSSYGGKIVKTK